MKNKSRAQFRSVAGLLGLLVLGQSLTALAQQTGLTEDSGLAAVYTDKLAGHSTASGEKYDPSKLTAAHRTLPFGTRVKVTNTGNNKSVTVTINDRGPKQKERVLDISASAAHALGISKHKMAPVKLEVVPAS
jgi:rare lipoprotein A